MPTSGPEHPWSAERIVEPALARELIEAQFPRLAPAAVEPLGEGWDNCVFAVNGAWVFRFPRREIAVALIEQELRLLPSLPPLPLPVPLPQWIGAPSERFPWPFAGYRLLPGRTADRAALTFVQRERAARPLGEFLRALHALPPVNAGPDAFQRLDAAKMRAQTAPRLAELGIEPPAFFHAPVRAPRADTLVHGDLHARQVLVGDAGEPCGVIDWGDAHQGDPACDLAVAHMLLPPSAQAGFREAYGAIDEETWALARLRALHLAAALGVWAKHNSDQGLTQEVLTALSFLRTS